MARAIVDLTGQRFGDWLVISRAAKPVGITSKYPFWLCRCVCGVERAVRGSGGLTSGTTTGCGCTKNSKLAARAHKHGQSAMRDIYAVWCAMRQRCYNPDQAAYHRYGGRGILICERWRGDDGFVNFRHDMGERTSRKFTIDRIDNDKGYWCGKAECPECGPLGREPNCRWATRQTQCRNTSRNVYLTVGGQSVCVGSLLDIPGSNRTALRRYMERGLTGDEIVALFRTAWWHGDERHPCG